VLTHVLATTTTTSPKAYGMHIWSLLCVQVRVFASHPEGVVTVRFKQAEPAQACVSLMDGRFFGGSKLAAHMWDGFTQYHGVSGSESESEQV